MRLVDLHCDWLWQYAPETTLFDAAAYAGVPARLPALDGYLQGAKAAVLFCSRAPADWAARDDRWASLDDLVTRYEAEFAGRLLIGPDDVARFGNEPSESLCWGTLGIGGLDFLLRQPAELDRLERLFERGARVFQLVAGHDPVLGGSAEADEEHGLTELGLAVLNRLFEIAAAIERGGPRPVVDIAGLNGRTTSDVLNWLEEDPPRSDRLGLLSSDGPHTGLSPTCAGSGNLTGIAAENLRRFRQLGGVIGLSPGLPAVSSAGSLHEIIESIAAIPFLGKPGYEGIGIGTSYFRLTALAPELPNVARLIDWLVRTFGPETARSLAERTAWSVLARAAGHGN